MRLKYEFGDFLNEIRIRDFMLPTQVTVVLSKQCNLKCKFCSVTNDHLLHMDVEFAKKLLYSLHEYGIFDICISGGEPSLHPQINEIIQYANSLKLRITLVTNGTVLDKLDEATLLAVNRIGISLHGSEVIHENITGVKGSYQQVIHSLEKLYKIRKTFNISYTCSNLNSGYEEMEHVAKIARKYEMSMMVARVNHEGKAIKGEYDVDPNSLVENVSRLIQQGYDVKVSNCITPCSVKPSLRYLTHGCSAGVSFCGIEPDGDVKVCPTASFSIGNLKTEKLEDIWNSSVMRKMRRLESLPLPCKSCYSILQCRGGCKIENYHKEDWPSFGDVLATNEFEKMWSEISDQRLALGVNYIRREEEDILILGNHLRICNDEVVYLLRKINGRSTGNEIVNQSDESLRKETKMLMIALYRDRIIRKVEG